MSTRSMGIALIFLCLAQCAGPAPKQPPPLPFSSAAHPSATAIASASAPALPPNSKPPSPAQLDEPFASHLVAPEDIPAIPPLPTKELRGKAAFLSTTCPLAIAHDNSGGVRVGCTTCPPFEGEDGRPNGMVEVDPDSFYGLNVLLFGSFTRPGAEEASASLDGCEPHAANYGGTLLAERRNGQWAAFRYDSGVSPKDCQTYRRKDGRDVLVCKWEDGHQGYWHEQIFVYDFGASTPDDVAKGWHVVLTMDDNSVASCWGAMPGEQVRSGRVEGFALKDVNADGDSDLVVTVSLAKSLPNAAYKTLCAKLTGEQDGYTSEPVDVTKALGKRTISVLEFVYDGKTFVPAPPTAERMKGL